MALTHGNLGQVLRLLAHWLKTLYVFFAFAVSARYCLHIFDVKNARKLTIFAILEHVGRPQNRL